jgi:uncharacterized membrane protein HdeD (DUF308 family)
MYIDVKKEVIGKFGSSSLIIGILLVVVGTLGIMLPTLISFAMEGFIASLLLIGGVLWSYHSFKQRPISFMNWLKPILLLVTGGLMFHYRLSGIGAIGLLLAIYLLMDAFGTFGIAHLHYPEKGWGWIALNGIVTLFLAMLFLIGWPSTSLWLVGLYVSISLLFDGWALIFIGWSCLRQVKK